MLPKEVTANELALLLGVSDQTVAKYAKKGIIDRSGRGKFDLQESVSAYCEHLRTVAAGRSGKEEQGSLAAERARLAKEQADGHALKNAQLRGEFVNAEQVATRWESIVQALRSGILAIPSRIQQRRPTLTASDVRAVEDEIREALKELGRSRDAD